MNTTPRFLCDAMLARLACYLRAAGRAIQLPFGSLDAQAAALSNIFGIDWLANAFTRCLLDNAPLRPATPDEIARIPDRARRVDEAPATCPTCGRIYWHGSHYKQMRGRLEN